jgi:hypothetical protein
VSSATAQFRPCSTPIVLLAGIAGVLIAAVLLLQLHCLLLDCLPPLLAVHAKVLHSMHQLRVGALPAGALLCAAQGLLGVGHDDQRATATHAAGLVQSSAHGPYSSTTACSSYAAIQCPSQPIAAAILGPHVYS